MNNAMRLQRIIYWTGLSLLAGLSAQAKEVHGPLFTVGVVADPQYADTAPRGGRTPREVPRRLKNAVDHFNRHEVDFVVSLGDFIDWDDIDYTWPPVTDLPRGKSNWVHFETLDALWQQIQAPRYHVLGNHEWYVPDRAEDGEKPGRVFRKFGFEDKAYYDFVQPGYRFVLLDGNDRYIYAYPKGSPAYADAKAYFDSLPRNLPERKDWNGAISQPQLNWLRATLDDASQKQQRVVLCCHYPIHEPAEPHSLLNHAEVRAILDDFPNVVLWLNGHNHRGGYALVNEDQANERHHLNFRGMQNGDGAYYRLEFFEDHIDVYRAEGEQPERQLSVAKVFSH